MSDLPLLSIVTPCYNAAPFLPRALQSIVAGVQEAGLPQGRIEHIIMDGGSTDGSADLIRAHARANPGLVSHWCSQPDDGQSDAINRGIAIARGQYATWLNADDWYERGGLAAMVARLKESPSPDVLVGRCRFADEAGRTTMEPTPPEPLSLANLLRLRSQWFNGRSLVQPEVFFRRNLFQEVGGLDTANHYSMDHHLWCRMLLAGARFERIEALIAAVRIHPGQKTSDNREVVRSLLNYALPMVRQARDILGPDHQAVEAELQAMGRKLRIADAVIRWWRRALDTRPLVRPPIRPDDQPSVPGESEPVVGDAFRTAARALRWRRRLRIGLFECDPHIAVKLLRSLGSRRVDLHIGSRSLRSLSQISAAARPQLSSRSSVHAHHGALVAGTFDLAVMQSVSFRTAAPQSAIADAWSRLAPGGILILLDDPYLTPNLHRYLDFLARRMGNLLSYDHDTVLHPDADEFIVSIADRQPPPPAIAGLDPEALVPRLAPAVKPIFIRGFGLPADHPLTPFPPIGPPDVSEFPGWVSSAWRRA